MRRGRGKASGGFHPAVAFANVAGDLWDAAMTASGHRSAAADAFDMAIVGAGFSGMYMLHLARRLGLRAIVLDAASDVGGTWYWNRYPGARCDIESMDYSYSFSEHLQQQWQWRERYAAQGEILDYARHVARRFDFYRDIRFATRIASAHYDADGGLWRLQSAAGERFAARYCVMATGCLSLPRRPGFQGLEDLQRPWYHTGLWPHEGVDVAGLNIGIVGTGSSAIQSIPVLARKARHLTVFQRTPNFSVPAWNRALDAGEARRIKADYGAFRERARYSTSGFNVEEGSESGLAVSPRRRRQILERRWAEGGFAVQSAFSDVETDARVNRMVVAFVHDKIRRKVDDPATARLLCPTSHPFGTKRLCVDSGYYETYNRPNVKLVDVRARPIARILPEGLELADGTRFAFDAVIFATGFDAMTGPLLDIDLRGRDGLPLSRKWRHGPRTYLGLAMAGFPNLFAVTGPQSPSVLTNMITAIEQHVEWIAACIAHLEASGQGWIEARGEAEDAWVEHNNKVGDETLYPLADSWYVGANIPGKPRVFLPYIGGLDTYRRHCDRVAAAGYSGFEMGAA